MDVIPEEGSSMATPPPNADDEKREEPGKAEPQEHETEEPIVGISTEVVVRQEREKEMDLAEAAQVEQGEESGEQVMTCESRMGPFI